MVVMVGRAENLQPLETRPSQSLVVDNGFGGGVDETATVYIAANVANQLELPVANEVSNLAADMSSAVQVPTASGDQYLSKPHVVSTVGQVHQNIQTYLVQNGDTIESLAQKFNVTSDTIIWANNLRSDSELLPNTELRILPINGLLHVVAPGDTPESIAARYQSSAAHVVSFNDLELNGLQIGHEVVVPNGVRPRANLSLGRAAAFDSPFAPRFGGNGYDYGWCTWWAAERRAQLGRAIPANWGNAISWRYNAAASGYRVGSAPEAGAVAYYKNIGGWGHVGMVEQVTADGAWFSDMNYPSWGRVTHRFVPASEFSSFSFIY